MNLKLSLYFFVAVLLHTDLAKANSIDISLNPYLGTGSVSDGSTVRSATGLRASISRSFSVSERLSLAPKVEVGNNYINTKDSKDDHRILSTYDNRYLVGGAQLGVLVGSIGKMKKEVYTSFAGGRAISKLNQDESGSDYFARKEYSGISGRYLTAEVGANIQVKRDISFNVALLHAAYHANAEKSVRNASGEVAMSGGKTFSLSDENSANRVPDHFVQKLYFVTFGLTVGI
jgi:hypothetical protein